MTCKLHKLFQAFLMLGMCFFSCSCAFLGVESPFRNDPLTGGIDARISDLLNITLPQGLQRYPSHGFIRAGENGKKEGLETFRGNVNGVAANVNLFNTMRQHGWQLRLSLRKGDRSIAIYEKNEEMALLAFHRQGMLTILEIWAGPRLADGAILSSSPQQSESGDAEKSIAGEEYGPQNSRENDGEVEERWGGELEERDL